MFFFIRKGTGTFIEAMAGITRSSSTLVMRYYYHSRLKLRDDPLCWIQAFCSHVPLHSFTVSPTSHFSLASCFYPFFFFAPLLPLMPTYSRVEMHQIPLLSPPACLTGRQRPQPGFSIGLLSWQLCMVGCLPDCISTGQEVKWISRSCLLFYPQEGVATEQGNGSQAEQW